MEVQNNLVASAYFKHKCTETAKMVSSAANVMQFPRIQKVVLLSRSFAIFSDKQKSQTVIEQLSKIAGQQACIIKAKKSVAAFQLREGMMVGCKVTLRNEKMYNFLYKLIHVALPRVRNLSAFSAKSFDNFGNFSFGITDSSIFPEVDYGDISFSWGMDITVVVEKSDRKTSLSLLKGIEFPFKD